MVLLGGMLSGIGGAILFFALWLQSAEIYFASFVPLAIVILISIIDTFFKEKWKIGFVHPDDLLFGNIFSFLYVIAAILGGGYFFYLGKLTPWVGTTQADMAAAMFSYAVVIFVSFIFLWGLSQLGWILEIIQGKGREVTKETTARFILFALILGIIMNLVLAGFNAFYQTAGFVVSTWILGGAVAAIMVLLGLVLRGRYEELPT